LEKAVTQLADLHGCAGELELVAVAVHVGNGDLHNGDRLPLFEIYRFPYCRILGQKVLELEKLAGLGPSSAIHDCSRTIAAALFCSLIPPLSNITEGLLLLIGEWMKRIECERSSVDQMTGQVRSDPQNCIENVNYGRRGILHRTIQPLLRGSCSCASDRQSWVFKTNVSDGSDDNLVFSVVAHKPNGVRPPGRDPQVLVGRWF
jgi:hypothetical protein